MQVVDGGAREPLRASSATEPIGAPECGRHIGERAGDICELLCLAQDLDRNILVRS